MKQGVPVPEAGALQEWTISGLHEHLAAHLPEVPRDAPVLDVGCGTGAWLVRLARLGHTELWGIDQRPDHARPPIARWAQADLDAADWGVPRRDFEVVTAIEVVEHLENRGLFYGNVAAHLKPGGYFLMTTPNMHSIAARFRFFLTGKLGQFDEKGDPTHLQPLLLTGMYRMLPTHGLKITRTWGYPTSGSLVYRRSVATCAGLLRPLLPETVPGDVLCLLARKEAGQQ